MAPGEFTVVSGLSWNGSGLCVQRKDTKFISGWTLPYESLCKIEKDMGLIYHTSYFLLLNV